MLKTHKSRMHPRRTNDSIGLLANGASGSWEIAIDETLSGPDRWWTQIDGPSVSLRFEIPTLETVAKMAQILQTSVKPSANGLSKRKNALVLGKDRKTPVCLFKDDEYDDRFFLLIGPSDDPLARIVIAGKDVRDLLEALNQVGEDLDDGQ